LATIDIDINKAAAFLNNDKLVAIPTETVYGLAGNALKAEVAAHIFKVKNRPSFDPLIVHIGNINQLEKYTKKIPFSLLRLAEKYWPGPLTLLLPKKNNIPDIITSGLERVAVRIPNHSLTLSLLLQLDFPLAAPSANPFGYVSPTTALHVYNQLGEKIPYILDGGACTVGLESTIVGEEDGKIIIYRLGGLSVEQIENTLNTNVEIRQSTSKPHAPGMLSSHYSPRKKVLLGNIDDLIKKNQEKKIGILSFSKRYLQYPNLVLAPDSNLETAAQHLFSYLRTLDEMDIDIILTEKVPDFGLGLAINDRLKRAAF
jgi:L-threonylcarbamoyladenylate synthase